MSNAVAIVIPTNIELPARLRGADIAAQIAAENAAAAGGIKTGGNPKVSIKANKFHIQDGDETTTLMSAPAAPGQPALPMMCLEVAVIAANPPLSKTFYQGEYVEGSKEAPTCSSFNGVTPDSHITTPQHTNCANCPQNAWGSKISKLSGKDIKACDDSKKLAILPAGDLSYKALEFTITKGSLTNWGTYIRELTNRNIPIFEIVTNVTFDATSNGVLQFGMNRYLTDDEKAKAVERSKGSDVRAIIQPSVFVPTTPALPAPTTATAPAVGTPIAVPPPNPPVGQFIPPVTPAPVAAANPVMPAYTPPTFVQPAAAAPAEEPPKRTRAKRTPAAPVTGDGSHLPPAIKAAYDSLPEGSPARAALLAQFPGLAAPVAAAPVVADVDPFADLPAHVKIAVNAVGGLGTPQGDAMFKILVGRDSTTTVPPEPPSKAADPAPALAFTAPAPAAAAPTAAAVSSGASLKDILQKKLGIAPSSTTVQ